MKILKIVTGIFFFGGISTSLHSAEPSTLPSEKLKDWIRESSTIEELSKKSSDDLSKKVDTELKDIEKKAEILEILQRAYSGGQAEEAEVKKVRDYAAERKAQEKRKLP